MEEVGPKYEIISVPGWPALERRQEMKLKDIKFEVVKNSAKKGWHLWYAGRGLKKDAQWALLACPLFIITVRY